MFGIDEAVYVKDLLKKNLKRKLDAEKEKIFQKIFKAHTKDELDLLKGKLNDLDKGYEEEVLKLEETVDKHEGTQLKAFDGFKSLHSNDNCLKEYKKNLISTLENSQYRKCLVCLQHKEIEKGDLPTEDINAVIDSLFCLFREDAHVIGELSVPMFLWDYIFDYQRRAIDWLLKLYSKGDGGILADEMGLGKTLQIITFLSSMYVSQKIKHCLIVCPTTIIDQWILEWKKYFPFVRVCVLHNTYSNNIEKLVKSFITFPCVIFVSYSGFRDFQVRIKKIRFDYVVLDEGHKIKNKNTGINKTMCAFKCENRIVLTGTPIQNNLKELWAIFDFINPGKLGTFADFCEEYEDPINRGQYSNATQSVIERAYRRTVLLRNIIDPFILRRLKAQVAAQLPKKSDKVVFCRMTHCQENLYKSVLESEHVTRILLGKNSCMGGLFMLRRICNHPFLHKRDPELLENLTCTSVKLINMQKMLLEWKKESRKVLIFTQMMDSMDIIKKFLEGQGYKYLTMSGKTTLSTRASHISQFNTDNETFVFLLTTRVGGLGLNLVGASRIIIYDPDWNPSTDSQAKERAWRYGQTTDVETYRFITMDTIEEKIYDKQIFKNLLSNKILKDPNLHKLFEKVDINDLFSYYKNDKKERIEEIVNVEDRDRDIIEILGNRVDPETIARIEFLRKKESLDDQEMIEFICMREEHDI